MGFPETSLTLVQRLASGGSEEDWRSFLHDYWGPICRFARRHGAANLHEAEDIASEVFEVLWKSRLLVRWVSARSARLHTLLCSVTRKTLSHRKRVEHNRDQLVREFVEQGGQSARDLEEPVDAFYASWVENLLQQAVESLAAEYGCHGQGDLVRVLYGRMCQGMTIGQVAEALALTLAVVDHHFRTARQRLADKLQQLVRLQVARYCTGENFEAEFALEWGQLGQFLNAHGGLDEAVRNTYALLDPVQARPGRESGLARATRQLTTILRTPPVAPSSDSRS